MKSFRIIVFVLLVISCYTNLVAFRIYDLKTDYSTEPLGIENPAPVFSWKMANDNPSALPILFDILPEKQKAQVANNLVKTIKRVSVGDDGVKYPENSLMTGFIGTAWISQALSAVNRDSVAYDLLFNEEFPSWLYPLTLDATTIWERLNSMTKENGMGGNNHMNSFNHYAYGSVLNWMINTIAGINPDKENPGFKHFYLKPVPDLK